MKKVSVIAAAVAATLAAGSAFAVDFHGYMRAGVGVNADGGQQLTFEKNKVGRLGNESDIYGEIQLGKEVYNNNGKTFYVDSMLAMTSNGSNDWEGTAANCGLDGTKVKCVDDAQFALRQFNVQAKGVLNFAPEATLWLVSVTTNVMTSISLTSTTGTSLARALVLKASKLVQVSYPLRGFVTIATITSTAVWARVTLQMLVMVVQ